MNKEKIIHYAVTILVVTAGVLVANNWIQPMINKAKVASPATN